ncbi:ribosome biogenesis GTPase Der [Candidatus Saccharibacteria bacterium]|nr:MAG: ribosome biogenesis GTPase Der [Candidatus Saccharibacteria bacterium]
MAKLPTVAIVGQTNVGKSSLFNRLYGSQEAIVAREAGTTRDNVVRKITVSNFQSQESRVKSQEKFNEHGSVDAVQGGGEVRSETYGKIRRASTGADKVAMRHDTRSYWLVDTAGLKEAEDDFEASIQDQITEATELADVILVVLDSTQYPSDQDRQIAKKALKSRKPVILVLNKVDLKGSLPNEEFLRLGIKTIQRTSAEHAQGLGTLRNLILAELPAVYESEPDNVLRIALIGRPNVGKSHLFNTLAGKQQAIVANIAGTTRDVNRVAVKYHTRDLELLDTAGIRRSGKQEVGIEKFSVLRTLTAIEEADICLLLMDVNELSTQLDQKIAGLIKEAGKGLVLVVSKWDSVEGKDAFTRDALAPQIAHEFAFVPWAPLIFTSSVTGQNVTKLFDLAIDIDRKRHQELKTAELNKILQTCLRKHPPAGLKNSHPKLRYMVQTDVAAPWFVIFGSNLKYLHWSYKRYLEHAIRAEADFSGTPLMFSFRDEKQIKVNREKAKTEHTPHP